MDTQTTEVMGRNWLVSQLVWDVGLEVARPERDHGVDLIAYLDLDETGGEFVACPIQMKAATAASFSVSAKYGKFSRLLMVYVWHVGELHEATCAFALSYAEALAVADVMGYTVTPSWAKGAYSTTEPSRRLRELLEPYRMGPGDWYRKVDQLGHS
ncbi:MAG: hypothetical protein WB765_07125 [Acidimicrobiales bacterium]